MFEGCFQCWCVSFCLYYMFCVYPGSEQNLSYSKFGLLYAFRDVPSKDLPKCLFILMWPCFLSGQRGTLACLLICYVEIIQLSLADIHKYQYLGINLKLLLHWNTNYMCCTRIDSFGHTVINGLKM